ncbi:MULTISPECIES: hypothetical protein [Micromonospora]|uniref:CU044_5270 family protein n=1 Tax=Micromonospora yangpuensis TaxID=683228 RepID=A0A1C6VB65_9ACTN|nr:hypothetical protein [Micromonospora yangpuensis]GGM12207.1 hypothetical protein GCM10012279_32860 [Micromonospora yangpuensis]SCL63583.1 hypothetical protein GA0070617_5246 [Micromonospora yangpuensis]
MNRRIPEMLADADPARGVDVGPGDVEALLDRARTDVTSYAPVAPARWRPSRLVPLGAFALVLVAAAVFAALRPPVVSLTPGTPGMLPEPTAVPAPCLVTIADRLQATRYDGTSGRYEYLHLARSSGMSMELPGGGGRFASARYPEETTRWLAEDGSGRVHEVRGALAYPDEESQQFFSANPGLRPRTGTTTTVLSPGEVALLPLPAADPDAFDQALYQPRDNGPSHALVGVADLNRERILDAAHRRAVLRFLATTDGVVCRGEQTDPEGRPGVVVSADRGRGPRPSPGYQGREYLLFDPHTGELLADGSGADATGAVTWSTRYLERGRTDVLG